MVRILIADDAVFTNTLLTKILHTEGHEVVGVARNGKEAIDLYKEVKPDLVLMDINMPEMDGLEALRNIKSQDPTARVVMCSAKPRDMIAPEAMALGARAYVTKPVKPAALLKIVGQVLDA